MSEKNWPIFWGMVALAAAIVIAGFVAAKTILDVKQAGDKITVTGSAKKPIRSDFVIWSGMVSARATTRQEAFPKVKGHVKRVKAQFKKAQIPDAEVTFKPLETNPLYETRTLDVGNQTVRRLVGYKLVQRFEVQSADVDRITGLSLSITDLVREGVPLVSFSPEYHFTKLGELRIEMLGEATKDARQRAEKMAAAVGSTVGALRSVRSGVFQITPRHSTEVSDYGMNDTSSLEKDITAVVKATFAVR